MEDENDELSNSVASLEDDVNGLETINAEQLATISTLNVEIETQYLLVDSLTANQESHSEVDHFTQIPEGWSMFGYTCSDSVNVMDAFSAYENHITIVKNELGWAWLVEYNFNALGSLQYGEGYQIKTTDTINDFQFCPNIE